MTLPHVRTGQKISAAHINRISDAASASVSGRGVIVSNRPGQKTISVTNPLGAEQPAIVVWGVAPEDMADVAAYQVIAIGSDAPGWGGGPGDNTPAVWITDFTEGNLDRMAVALEPIAGGQAGFIAISGVAWALTDGTEIGLYANPTIGSRILTTAEGGSAQILFHDVTNQIAQIRFPVGGAGGEGGISWQFVWNEGPNL